MTSTRRPSRCTLTPRGTWSGSAFTYAYATSTNPNGYNSWADKTVETLPDGSTVCRLRAPAFALAAAAAAA